MNVDVTLNKESQLKLNKTRPSKWKKKFKDLKYVCVYSLILLHMFHQIWEVLVYKVLMSIDLHSA